MSKKKKVLIGLAVIVALLLVNYFFGTGPAYRAKKDACRQARHESVVARRNWDSASDAAIACEKVRGVGGAACEDAEEAAEIARLATRRAVNDAKTACYGVSVD